MVSILISERIVRDDVLPIHIEKMKLWPATQAGTGRNHPRIPNVGEEALKNLDEAGIVYVGAELVLAISG